MNILHMKYAVEVAKAGSVNKAAEALYIGQPNLSRAIKELEASLGITIFSRSAKGMFVTPEGEEFLSYAKSILQQIDDVEALYNGRKPVKQKFSVSAPRAGYIAEAFAEFSKCLDKDKAEIFYCETNSMRTVNKVLRSDYKMGILRYNDRYDKYFAELFDRKELAYERICEFNYVLVMRKDCKLAELDEIRFSDLEKFVEVDFADPYLPTLPLSEMKREEAADNINRRIFVFERASRYEILSTNPIAFAWVSPLPKSILDRYGLIQKCCIENKIPFRDVLIYRKDRRLTKLDEIFIKELKAAKEKHVDKFLG